MFEDCSFDLLRLRNSKLAMDGKSPAEVGTMNINDNASSLLAGAYMFKISGMNSCGTRPGE